jgi:large subunit ribosomal protein L29
MAHLKNKTIRELNEKDLRSRLKQIRAELFKLRIESKKGTLRKESGKLKPFRKDIARLMTRINELKRK